MDQMPLRSILERNLGNVLTPELIAGIVLGYELAIPDSVYSTINFETPRPPAVDDPRLVIDRHEVGDWVAKRVGGSGNWGDFAAIGLRGSDGRIVAGVVFNNVTPTDACIHVAFEGRYSLKRCLLYAAFDYAFNQLKLERLTAYVEADNEVALRFDRHIGFEDEHVIRKGCGGDVIMLVMWRETCRWISHGQKIS